MTLNEKLNYIATLETDGYSEDVIESLIEGLEHPEAHYCPERFESASDLLNSILAEDSEDGEN